MSWFSNLNLKPNERRWVIGVLVGFFVLANVWFVWPHFGDWARSAQKAKDTENSVNRYQKEVNNIPKYRALVKELEQDGGSTIAAAEQAVHFQKTIQEIASRSGVVINRYDPANPRRSSSVGASGNGANGANSQTNMYFEESGLSVQMQQVDEKDLVLFLYNLGNGNSNVRVKEMELNPNNTKSKLVCKALLIASYQKSLTNKNQLAPSAKAATATNKVAINKTATNKAAASKVATNSNKATKANPVSASKTVPGAPKGSVSNTKTNNVSNTNKPGANTPGASGRRSPANRP